jgi:hypothetical protein
MNGETCEFCPRRKAVTQICLPDRWQKSVREETGGFFFGARAGYLVALPYSRSNPPRCLVIPPINYRRQFLYEESAGVSQLGYCTSLARGTSGGIEYTRHSDFKNSRRLSDSKSVLWEIGGKSVNPKSSGPSSGRKMATGTDPHSSPQHPPLRRN